MWFLKILIEEIKRRLFNFMIAVDQLVWNIITIGHSSPDETVSAGCWRMEQEGKWQGKLFRPIIDLVFYKIEKEHCRKAYLSEVMRTQSRYISISE
jgi:hypothetical protein